MYIILDPYRYQNRRPVSQISISSRGSNMEFSYFTNNSLRKTSEESPNSNDGVPIGI